MHVYSQALFMLVWFPAHMFHSFGNCSFTCETMSWWLPSGRVKIAIENGPVEIVSFPTKQGGFFHSFL